MSVSNGKFTPDWKTWLNVSMVELWEGVVLSMDIDPLKIPKSSRPLEVSPIARIRRTRAAKEFDRRLLMATRSLGGKPGLERFTLIADHPELCEVSLPQFAHWACSVDWEVPDKFIEIGDRWAESAEGTKTKWPWGEHETELLRHLAAAAKEWWSTYDPEQISTAPKNVEVSAWLEGRGVRSRIAQVMAQILRADGLRTGPRK